MIRPTRHADHRLMPPTIARSALRLVVCIVAFGPSSALGQDSWNLTPYQVEVILAIEDTPELSGVVAADLRDGLEHQIDAIIGPNWSATVHTAEADLHRRILDNLASMSPEVIAPEQLSLDKVLMIAVRAVPDGFEIQARDFDCRTRRWSLPQTITIHQTGMLRDSVFDGLVKAFAPVAKIESDMNKQVVLNGRASDVPLGDETMSWFRAGQVAIPILRRNDRDGNPKKDGIQEVPWTNLLVDDVESPDAITCVIHSGTRNPLNIRRRGRIDQLALVINQTQAPTQLVLRSRIDKEVPLAGYEIHTSKPGEKTTEFVGTTDRHGSIEIEPNEQLLQILFVKNGGELLARLPLVPGFKTEEVAPMPDDEPRLRAEGGLRGLRDTMVDTVARRQILIARIRRLIESGDLESAETYFDQLLELPDRKPLTIQVDALQSSNVTEDARVQARIDRMFRETRNMLAKYLDPREINELRSELDAARAGSSSAAADDRSLSKQPDAQGA